MRTTGTAVVEAPLAVDIRQHEERERPRMREALEPQSAQRHWARIAPNGYPAALTPISCGNGATRQTRFSLPRSAPGSTIACPRLQGEARNDSIRNWT